MKKFSEWATGDFLANVSPNDEIDDEMYWYFLEVLPPRVMENYGFLVGEPARHNGNGQAVYDAFYQSPDGKRFYYGGQKTVKEFIGPDSPKYPL